MSTACIGYHALLRFYYTDMGAEYRNERVCVCVCVFVCLSVRVDIFGTTRPIFAKFFVHVAYGCGSVLRYRQHSDTRYVMYFLFYG